MPDEIVETPAEETVLSNNQPAAEAKPEVEVPKTKTPEEKEKARIAYERRQQQKNWRAKLHEIESRPITDEERQVVADLAKKKGYDTTKEENKSQVDLIAEANAAQIGLRNRDRNTVLVQAARENLASTLEDLGYEKGSPAYDGIGNYLFRKIGTRDPDAYANKEVVEQEIESYTAAITQKAKPVDAIARAVTSKAGSPKGAAESRNGVPTDAEKDLVKQKAKQFGVSETKVPKILEQQKKLPSWARPRL